MSGPRSARAALAALLCCLVPLLPSCVTVGRSTIGSMPTPEAVRALKQGQSVREVLAACGSPVEAWAQPDGLLLLYRRRHYDYNRYGFDASQLTRFIDFSNSVTSALANLSLTIEDGALGDDRLAVLFDREGRVAALSYRSWDGGAP